MIPIQYLVASPQGDLAYTAEDAGVLLEGCPAHVTYGAYFAGIDRFLNQGGMGKLLAEAGSRLGETVSAGSVAQVVARAEKHGALYHPASLEVRLQDGRSVRAALAVATWERGRIALARECECLSRLHGEFAPTAIPRPREFQDDGRMAYLLEEWFEDFHEFHVTVDGRLSLWDFRRGLRDIPPDLWPNVYEQATSILVSCYGFATGDRIWPWHHAAGDFIVRLDGGEADVRLTTVRDYAPWAGLDEDEVEPVTSLFYYFLETAMRMRLDKVEGTGTTIWLGEHVLRGTVRGFLNGLSARKGAPLDAAGLRDLTCSLQPDELAQACSRVAETFHGDDGLRAEENAAAQAIWLQTVLKSF